MMLEVEGLRKEFSVKKRKLVAVDDVSFSVDTGETVALVGESGCGKTTTGRIVVKLETPTAGSIKIAGDDMLQLNREGEKNFRRRVSMIFQDPFESLNPRFNIMRSVREPLDIHSEISREEKEEAVKRALREVGINPPEAFLKRYPHELSGGQRQRVAIARALVLKPNVIVADEPCSMLDVSIRAGILTLLKKLKDEMDLSMLYIAHDLSEARYISDRMAVMYLGRIVETGDTEDVLNDPRHPYTKALIAAVPDINPDIYREEFSIKGDIPSAIDLPKGCRFNPRCPYAFDRCREEEPGLIEHRGHSAACWLV